MCRLVVASADVVAAIAAALAPPGFLLCFNVFFDIVSGERRRRRATECRRI
jgi:hypothetical protein